MVKLVIHAHTHSHIHKNYMLFPVMQALLKLHRVKYHDRSTNREPLSVQVGQIYQMISEGVGLGGVDNGATSEVEGQPDTASNHPQEQVCVCVL